MAPDISKALAAFVTADSAVKALIVKRFYPVHLPQSVIMPAASYQFLPGGRVVQAHGEKSSLPRARVQITMFGVLYVDCAAVDAAIKQALDGQQGSWGSGSFVTEVESCVVAGPPADGVDPETGLLWRTRDFFIMWKE